MTQIKGFIPPTRRADVLGVHSLDHFSFAVPDLAKAQEFYSLFGLDTRAQGSHLDLRTFGHQHLWGRLTEASRKQLSYLSFGIFEEDLERFRARLQQQNIELLPPPAGLDSNSLWLRENNGLLIELKVAEKTSPNEKSAFAPLVSTPPGVRGAIFRNELKITQPRRLAHVLIFVSDIAQSIRFYSDVFGLNLSDEAGGGVAFMHGVHGSDHHLVAFAKAEQVGFHHCSWDVGSIREIGMGAMQMAEGGYEAGWGLGQHVLGSNYFHYVRDPWGSYSEYSADIDYIPETMNWEGQSHSAENGFYLWGPNAPKDFAVNYEAPSLTPEFLSSPSSLDGG